MGIMIGFAVRAGLVLASSLALYSAEPAHSLRTGSVVGVFSRDGVLVRLENILTGEAVTMGDAVQFSFQTESGEISDRNSRRVAMRFSAQSLEVRYAHPDFETTVSYRARADDHFIEKQIRIRHVGNSAFENKRLSAGRWSGGAQDNVLAFQHGQCVTCFLRKQKGGFFFGVRTPFEEVLPREATTVDLAYPVNMIFDKGASYDGETAYWGVYRRTGRLAARAPAKIKESILSEFPLDAGESDAMLRMVRKLAPPRGGVTVVYNGYQGGLFFGDYGDPGGLLQAARDIEVLRNVKEMLGPCIVQPAGPFFGNYRGALLLNPTDDRLPESPGRRSLIDWINANGMMAMNWACLKSVHGWVNPRLGPYCSKNPEWQADQFTNCAADPAYMRWFKTIVLNDLKTGFAGFVSDEPPPGLRYRLFCEKQNHMHLPGDVSYAYFFRRREMFREMRRQFGPDFELQGQRPHQDAGIWDATYLNSVFTFLENPGLKAETFREWARMRRHYTFVPSSLDQIIVQPGFEPVDYTMLSALAVSSNYLFIAPIRREQLRNPEANLNNSGRMARSLEEFQERQRVRFWLDWARQHRDYMDEVIDLPDWPSSGRPDGYLRIRNGTGFAFLFNSADSEQTISIPLRSEVKLDRGRTYRLEQLHPTPGLTVTARSQASWKLPGHSAFLIAIQPVQ